MLKKKINQQPESCVISIIYTTFAYRVRQRYFLMYTMAEKQIDTVLGLVEGTEENKDEKWMCHSQAIAATMSNRMEELGMTQRALAEKMNCTQQYVSKVLKGRENLSLETLCKIENALDIKILQARINK